MSHSAQMEIDPRDAAIEELHASTAVYTARPVVEDLLRRIDWPRRGGRLLDPSAGDGAFLLAALDSMEIGVDDFAAASRVRGMEIHFGAVCQARQAIETYLCERRGWSGGAARTAAGEMVAHGDFLADVVPSGEFSAIVGNPPYLRQCFLPGYFRDLYAAKVPPHARGDMLHAFLDKCCAIIPDNGVIAMVTSDRWVINRGCADLRASIGRRVGVTHLERLDCASAFYRPKKRTKGTPPRVHPIAIVLERAASNSTPLTAEEFPLGGSVAGNTTGVTLGDIAEVRLAPWLGPKGVFVVDEVTAAGFTGADLLPAVDVEDIPPHQDILLPARRYAIRTRSDKEPQGAVAEHLKRGFSKMSQRGRARGGSGAKRTTKYWMPPEAITIPLTGQRLLVPRIARRVRVVELPEGVLPFNHNLQIAVPARGVSIESVRDVLLAEETTKWIEANAPRLESGYFSITVGLLRRLPVPDRLLPAQLAKAG